MTDKTENITTLLILSDLHAVSGTKNHSDSFLAFENGQSEFANDFISYLKKLKFTFDVLVCPGDIANKADEEAFIDGWNFLQRVQSELHIPQLLCVPGNHDHKSRDAEGLSPTHFLQYLKPRFPIDDNQFIDHFWGWNWAPVGNEKFNSILINTSAYHGYSAFNDSHGRIAEEACNKIGEYIKGIDEKDFNILLCHHAPYKMEHAFPGDDNQEIKGAQNLIHILETNNHTPWLVIHGHKHFGDLRYAISKKNAPTTLFSAGSLSAKSKNNNPNQFHILKIHSTESKLSGKVVGISYNYEYYFGRGWQPSNSKKIPAISGFGSSVQIPQLAKELAEMVNNDSSKFLEGGELGVINNKTVFFTQEDINFFVHCLKKLNISVEISNNEIIEAGISNDNT